MKLFFSMLVAGIVMFFAFLQRLSAMPGTYYDPTVAYGSGGLDRETGQNIPAALWQRLMDMLEFITGGSGTWTDFTPTLDQGGAVAITVNYARYAIIGKTAVVQVKVTATGAGTSNKFTLNGIPAAIAIKQTTGGLNVLGNIVIVDSGTAIFNATAVDNGANSVQGRGYNSSLYAGAGTPAMTIASGDTFYFGLCYEIA